MDSFHIDDNSGINRNFVMETVRTKRKRITTYEKVVANNKISQISNKDEEKQQMKK
jgi:hypothetical protein